MRTIFFILAFFCSLPAAAQQHTIVYGFRLDTVAIRSGETFSNSLWIQNNSSAAVVLFEVRSPGTKKALLHLPDSIFLQPREKRWFPLKYFANRETIQSNIQSFTIQLASRQQAVPVQGSARFLTRLEQVSGIALDTDGPEVYLSQLSRQTKVTVYCYNSGLVTTRFHLELSHIPEGLEFSGNPDELELAPGTRQQVVLLVTNKLRSTVAADFAIMIRALDVSGNQLAVKNLRMLNISDDHRLTLRRNSFSQAPPNTISLRYLTVSPGLSAYQLQGNGSFPLADSQQLRYRINADYLNRPEQKGINLYDTYIDYQSKRWGVRAGTIYDLLDFNLNGRGLRASFKPSAGRSLSIYGVENNYLLYSSHPLLPQNNGNTFALNYTDTRSGARSSSVLLLRSSNNLLQTTTTLLSGNITIPTARKIFLGVEGGYSMLQPGKEQQHPGFAAGIRFLLERGQFNLYSYNYFSSPYYGGLRRGLLQLDNSVSLSLNGKGTVSGALRLLNNNPKLLYYFGNEYLSAASQYGNAVYEIGYAKRLGLWNLTLKPYYFTQTITLQEAVKWRSASVRGKLTGSYSFASHTVFIDADNGYTFQNTSSKPEAPFLSSRINASYKSQVLGFNAMAQFNSYYLTDALALPLERPRYTFISLGPTASLALFRQKVLANTGLMYNYSGYNHSSNYSVNSNIRWRLKNNWALAADVLYGVNLQPTAYNVLQGSGASYDPGDPAGRFRYYNRQLRLGIEKSFGQSSDGNNCRLELVYYADLNANGKHDRREPAVSSVLVKVDGITAVTNQKGSVKITGERNKRYTISVISNNNWSLLEPTEITLRKNTRLEIPLVKTELLTGKLVYTAEKYSDTPPVPSGLRVKATSAGGAVFTTLTNEQGLFQLYLPENTYTVTMETAGLHFVLLSENKPVTMQYNHPKTLELNYTYRERKVEVTRFD
ncbi:hypothetical protein [Niabella beijingensis]|uniref:hypothetical protein n=1 Tax=Niabella beijingensis TaxID=2872700 RepID=UPI001CBF5BE8|nr:hypothetical protein [Niabella beijingensis]MBZ4189109.1 hypothetical protein [Niabella beijingensis]